ncbi:MAG: glutathione peroxidase [Bdellovibrionaceae bacterium]|jgi:glutathione peroxidase|nr:glutathione peroxidase [Pseudobdellovibrionaceae bacterium]
MRLLLIVGVCFYLSLTSANAIASTSAGPKSFFELSATDISGKKIHFSQFRGKVVLVVNTASECGFTPQLKDLEDIYKKYLNKGFIVLAFPSNDFHQEKQDNPEILKFTQKEYKISFPLFDKGPIRGKDKQPVYQFLTDQKPGVLFKDVTWNFEKFLINRQGQVVDRWSSMTSPSSNSILNRIELALAEPM